MGKSSFRPIVSPIKNSADGASNTQDNSFDAARAPVGGNHSPLVLQGRSVRELEEQMSTLRNENFNLKLRIYFMEENQHGGAREKNAGDAMAKQLIDAKVEVEVLRKRITEKTELLKDAAHAITLHEEAQKKSDAESQAMLEHMQQYIQTLEARLENTTQQQTAEQSRPMQTDILRLEEALSAAERQSSEFQAQQSLLQKALNESQESLQNCEAKITELAIKNSELVEQMSQLAELEKVANQTIKNQKLELHACLKENKSILYNISAVELELLQQQRWMNDAASVLHRHGKTLNLMENINHQKDRVYSHLFERILRKQCELGCLTSYYCRDSSSSIPRVDNAMNSLLLAKRLANCGKVANKFQFPITKHGNTLARQTISVAAPSTAFTNYSVPVFPGLNKFLWRWYRPYGNSSF